MNSTSMRRMALGAALACGATLLAACGGGGGGEVVVETPTVPPAAATDAAQAVEFTRGQAASRSESAEPIELGTAGLATSESAEPDENV